MSSDPRYQRIISAQPYPLLFATVGGAHLYGFALAQSQVDVRGAHVLPLDQSVGLDPGDETVEDAREVDGVQMNMISHDVRKFFGLLLKKNGYVLEQLFSPIIARTTPEHAELKAVCAPQYRHRPAGGKEGDASGAGENPGAVLVRSGVITKHHAHHYLGLAETQWQLFLQGEPAPGTDGAEGQAGSGAGHGPRRLKRLLSVYRVLLSGIHLMRTGEVESDLVKLNDQFRVPYIPDLIEQRKGGDEKPVPDADVVVHQTEYGRLRGQLESAYESSSLPDMPDDRTRTALNELLVRIRIRGITA